MPKTARQAAADALLRVSKGGYSNIVLDAELKRAGLDSRDAAFASALFYGTLERRVTLDALIARYSSQGAEKLSPEVLETLRMGFYQLLYMDSVTDPAAVNESVELVKALGNKKAGGFVNGVMRAFIRGGKAVELSGLSGARRLSVEYSAPEWLCEKWSLEYGESFAREALASSLGAPPVYARVNTLKITAERLMDQLEREGMAPGPVEGFPDALTLSGAAPQNTESYINGYYHVQDISSQLAAEALGAGPGSRVFDPCAAPGGKSFTIAELMGGEGEIVAGDLHGKRAALVAKGAQRLGLGCIKAIENDGAKYDPALGLFDFVLCDVPCSGLGVLRRKPEIRFKEPEDMAALPEIQFSIARAAAESLRIGGTLLYSTCTLSRAENDEVTARLTGEAGLTPAALPERVKKYSEDGYSATLRPGAFGNDGFYFARLTKR